MEGKTENVDSQLRGKGHRLTPRRLMVVQVLADRGGHLTVEDILSGVQYSYPRTNKTTVYRTLELLRELGLVVVTDLGGGRLEYELVDRPHHHLICEKCGMRTEVDDLVLQPLRARLLEQYGFLTNLDHFALFGICPDCRAEAVAQSISQASSRV